MDNIDINTFIPSFSEFIEMCKESDIESELFKEILFEFLDNPKKYGNGEIIKHYLNEKLPIDNYTQLINRLKI